MLTYSLAVAVHCNCANDIAVACARWESITESQRLHRLKVGVVDVHAVA